MSATIGRDHVVDLVSGNWRPFAVHFNFVMVANHTTLGRATVHNVAARTSAVVSIELRVEAPMPLVVADTVIPFLCRRTFTQKHGDHAEYRHRLLNATEHDRLQFPE